MIMIGVQNHIFTQSHIVDYRCNNGTLETAGKGRDSGLTWPKNTDEGDGANNDVILDTRFYGVRL